MPFIDKELQKLSQDIINRALVKQKPIGSSNLLSGALRQSILNRKNRLPRK